MQARLLFRTTGRRLAAVAFGVALLYSCHGLAQVTAYPPMRSGQSTVPGESSTRGSDPASTSTSSPDLGMSPEFAQSVLLRREAARKIERKKRMVDNANRLLELTQQLRAELATREATPDDAKRLDEIARLARLVKDQMRD